MLKILWKREEIAPEEQFLLLFTIFCYLLLDFYVKTGIRFSFRDKRLFEITEVEITRVYCNLYTYNLHSEVFPDLTVRVMLMCKSFADEFIINCHYYIIITDNPSYYITIICFKILHMQIQPQALEV